MRRVFGSLRYNAQGQTLDDLREHLKDLYHDMTSGQIPGIREVG